MTMVVEKVTFIHTESPVPDGYSEIFKRMGLGLLKQLEKQYGNHEKLNDDLHEILTKKIKGLKRLSEYLSEQDSADKGKAFQEGMMYAIKAFEKAIDSWVSSLPAPPREKTPTPDELLQRHFPKTLGISDRGKGKE